MPQKPISLQRRIARLEAMLPAKARKQATIVLPNGSEVSLVAAREKLLNIHSWRNVDPKRMRAMLQKQQTQFDLLDDVVRLREQGKSANAIGREVGISSSAVEEWLGGKALPLYLSSAVLEMYDKMRRPINVPKNRHKEFAYVLGALFGNVGMSSLPSGHGERLLELRVIDKEFADEFAANIAKSIGRGVKANRTQVRKRQKKLYLCEVYSAPLIQFLNRITNYRERIPVEFLLTKDTKKNFLRAIFDSNGTVKGVNRVMRFIEYRTRNPELVKTVSIYLLEQGIENIYSFNNKEGRYILRINALNTNKFRDIIGFRAKRKQSLL